MLLLAPFGRSAAINDNLADELRVNLDTCRRANSISIPCVWTWKFLNPQRKFGDYTFRYILRTLLKLQRLLNDAECITIKLISKIRNVSLVINLSGFYCFGGARSKGFAQLRNVSKLYRRSRSYFRMSRSCFGISSRYLEFFDLFFHGERNHYEEELIITFWRNK